MFLVLLYIGDIATLIKGIEDWKKKIDKKEGRWRNAWLLSFYILTPILVILTLYLYCGFFFKK